MTTATMTTTTAKTVTTKRMMLGTVDWVSDTEGEHSLVKVGDKFFTFWQEDVKAGSRKPAKGDKVFFVKGDSEVFDTASQVQVVPTARVLLEERESMKRAEAWVEKREQMEREAE